MKYADFRFVPVMIVDRFKNAMPVADKSRKIVILTVADGIPTVIPEVIDDEVEIVGEQRPERVIEIDRKTVAVTKDEPGARRVPMPPQGGDGVIVKAGFARRKWLGYLPHGF